jgi:hypothetical protein
MNEVIMKPSAIAKTLDILRNFPIWFLSSITLALCCLLWLPLFDGLVSDQARGWLIFSTVSLALMAACRTISTLCPLYFKLQKERKAERTFHITPVDNQSFWKVAKQPDGSIRTQIHISFTAKNMTTNAPVHLMKARLVKPKMSNDGLCDLLMLRAPDRDIYGSAHTSGHYIPAGNILPGSISFMPKGVPKKKSGPLKTIFSVQDADGNEIRTKINLREV